MPTVLNSQGFRFFFYSNENDEPIHIHVEGGGGTGKIWLVPALEAAYFHNFFRKRSAKDLGNSASAYQ